MNDAIYLSRLAPDLRSREARRDLDDCMAMHRTLMSAFPDQLSDEGRARAEAGVLYRLDSSGDRPYILVQSTAPPNWGKLPPKWLRADVPATVKQIGGVMAGIEVGRRLRFKLVANPTRKIDTKTREGGTKSNGRRVELRGESECLEWLARKGEQNGFRPSEVTAAPNVADVRVARELRTTGRKQMPGGRPSRLTFSGVAFEGRLEVLRIDLFLEGLRKGIGSGKAYGFGLLSLGPDR
jgi:CRISPR system Cascade subunit CasE